MQTEFEFTLPRGYMDEDGRIHRNGRMRLATALDEIQPMEDPRVAANASYLAILLLSRVVTNLGQLSSVTPAVIERLFAADLAYLQQLYLRLNSAEQVVVGAVCPHCSGQFNLQVAPLGE
ncbi:MAG: hypothetical protein WAM60_23260 [Candidatus Promineifilaceae bacterium]